MADCSAKGGDTTAADQNDGYIMTQVDNVQADEAAANVIALLENGEVTAHAPAASLVRDGVKVYTVDAGSENFTSVTFPISGDHSETLSNLTVLFNADDTVVQYSESLVSQSESGTAFVTTYVDGALTNTQDTGIFYVDDGQQEVDDSDQFSVMKKSTKKCLMAVLGISGFAAGVLAYLCVGACSVPITPVTAPVCATCIGGAAVVAGASITQIGNCF